MALIIASLKLLFQGVDGTDHSWQATLKTLLKEEFSSSRWPMYGEEAEKQKREGQSISRPFLARKMAQL